MSELKEWDIKLTNNSCPFRQAGLDDIGSSNMKQVTNCILRSSNTDKLCNEINCIRK